MSVEAFLYETILELIDIDEEDLTRELKLEEIGLTSLDYVEIQVLVRKRYGVQITPELLTAGEIKNLGDFADYIRNAASPGEESEAA